MCKSKNEGGLGFVNLHNLNMSLLGKWLWKFIDNNDSSVWKEIISNHYHNGTYNLYHVTPSITNNF